jgi:nucleotide-binding universal stress UspA family protein
MSARRAEVAMAYKTLMVHLELYGDNEGVLEIAGSLAERFDARIIGIAACQPVRALIGEGFNAGEAITEDFLEIEKELAATEEQFRTALRGRAKSLEWRSTITYGPLYDYIADEARAADLIITGKDLGPGLFDETRRVNLAGLAMCAGRPILIVPQGINVLALRHVVVGWKDTSEARRAAADALPLLQAADHLTVLTVTAQSAFDAARGRVADVSAWLAQHQVESTNEVVVASGPEASCLRAALQDRKCDLLVAGAYGHNRLSEWIFGGITEDVLLDPDFCVLLSH